MTDNEFIISTMRWSFSRLEAFYTCPYGWYEKYINCNYGKQNAYAQYGSVVHSLIEKYYKNEISEFDLAPEFEHRFAEEITEPFPYNKYTDLQQSYFEKGLNYFQNFMGVYPNAAAILGVEKKVEFEIEGYPFVGYIDLLVRDMSGRIVIIDNKSASMKWNKNGKLSKSSEEKMDMYKKQLYLYAYALKQQGMKVDSLCWNFFNEQKLYEIPFCKKDYNETVRWAIDTIHMIEAEEEFAPKPSFYYCKNICDRRDECEFNEWRYTENNDGSGLPEQGI